MRYNRITEKDRQAAHTSVQMHARSLQVATWIHEFGLSMDDFTPWNSQTGVCFHKETGMAISNLWSYERVREFVYNIVTRPT